METQAIARRYDLDWLRVLAILAIFVFHCTRAFDPDGWFIKNPTTYVFVDVWKAFATSWGLPLILLLGLMRSVGLRNEPHFSHWMPTFWSQRLGEA